MRNRLRLMLAPMVTMLLVLQSLMPGVWAQNESMVIQHDAVKHYEQVIDQNISSGEGEDVLATGDDTGDVVDSGTGEATGDVDPNGGDTASEVSNGEVTDVSEDIGEVTEPEAENGDITNTGDGNGEGTEPEAVNVEDAEADGTNGDDAGTSGVVAEDDEAVGPVEENDEVVAPLSNTSSIAPMAIVGPGVTSVTVSPTTLADVCDPIRADGTWEVGADSVVGDTFTLEFDARLNVRGGVRDIFIPGTTELIAKMIVSENVATFQMQVDGATGGGFFLESSNCWAQSVEGYSTTVPFTASSGATWNPTVELPRPGPNTDISKSGVLSGETITWSVSFPSGPSNGATINDLALEGWTFDTSTFAPTNAGGSAISMTGDAEGITVTSGAYTTGKPSFTIEATLDADWASQNLPTDTDGGTIFKNSISGTNVGVNGVEADLGPVVAQVVKPLPPAGNTDISKSGVLSGDTIIWTVILPSGPSNGVTIEDLERPGWEFDTTSFAKTDVGGSELEMTTGADGITVTSGDYTTGKPSFTIKATLVQGWENLELPKDSADGTIFENIVTGTNIGLNGETTDLGPVDATVTKPLPLGPGTEIVKSGSFTDDETITWTIYFPAGPSAGASIDDDAMPGWTFDFESFKPTNVGGSDLQITGDANGIQVTSGPYDSGIPSFTIEAQLVEGWEEHEGLETDDDGAPIFTNTITGENIGENGVGIDLGPVVGEATKPLPAGPGVDVSKSGVLSGETITWTVYFPTGPSAGATIVDPALEGWTFDTTTFTPINAGGSTVAYTGDADGITVTSGAYSEGTPGFTIKAKLDTDWETQNLPTNPDNGATIFDNTINGTNTGMNGETKDLGPITAVVEKPLPEAPKTDVTKSGSFTGDETITWSVSLPSGPSNGVTIEDLELPGWEFVEGSFSASNVGGSNLQITEGADGITVTSGVYTTGKPSFTIEATLVDGWQDLGLPTGDGGSTTFSNTITGENIGENGDTEDLGPVTAEAVKPGPPETGTNPSKDGAWTNPNDQGALFPEGAITWKVELPHGPAQSAVITDLAGEGWTFDCSTFEAGDFWTDGVRIEMTPTCSEDLLIVNVGAYGGNEWYVPSFTIKADITDTPSHQNGRGYNNTATSVVYNIDGSITKNGTITTEWLVQQSGFGGDGRPYSIPMDPIVNDAVCENGVEPNPSIQLPADAFGLTYQIVDQIDPETGNYTVAATISDSYQWGFLGDDWSFDEENPSVAVYHGNVEIVPCEQVDLVLPTVDAAVCEGGVEPSPSIVGVPTFATGDDVLYTITQEINGDGSFIVTATIANGVNKVWPSTLPSNDFGTWAHAQDGNIVFTGHVTIVDCDPIVPVLPGIDGNVCEGGVPYPIQVTRPVNTDEIEYAGFSSVRLDVMNNAYIVTGTATIVADGVAWNEAAFEEGWSATSPTVANFRLSIPMNGCTEVIPQMPTLQGNVCEGGAYTEPSVRVPADTAVITYGEAQIEVENGVITVTVTAQIPEEGYMWSERQAPFYDGWEVLEDRTIAQFTESYDVVPCIPVTPQELPDIEGNVCEGGFYTPPTVSFTGVDGVVTYTGVELGELDNGTYRVIATATLADGYAWNVEALPTGWSVDEENPANANYEGWFAEQPCAPVIPNLPTVTGNVCEGGFYTAPSVSFGEDIEGVTLSDETIGGGVITATAVLDDGFAWNTDSSDWPTGWTVDEENPARATFAGTYVEAPCAPVVPANPVVEQAVCEGGVVAPPSVTVTDTDRVTYEIVGEITNGGTVTIVGTLSDGFEWDWESDLWPEGWFVNPENLAEATRDVVLDNVECTPVVPDVPIVTPAVCEGGEASTPNVELPTTPGVTYTKDGNEVIGGTVTITAIVEPGYGWGELPEGWTADPTDPSRVTFEVTFEDPCTPVVPEVPVVTPAVCEDGTSTEPNVELPTTPGIAYSKSGEEVPGGTVIITATVEPGFKWGDLPEGWTADPTDPSRVTFEVTFEDPCTPVVPEAPVVTPAVCEDNKVVPPSVELPTTPGVTYTKSGEEVPGGTVTITATIEPGFEWGEMPEGWTQVGATTATFTVTFPAAPDCDPATEKPVEVTELPSTGTGSLNVGLSILLASMAGLMLAAVALRLNAYKRS